MINEIYKISFKDIDTKEELLKDNFEFEDLMYFKQLDILKTDILDKDEKEQYYKIVSVDGGFKLTNTEVEIYLKKIDNINHNDTYKIDKKGLNMAVQDMQELSMQIKNKLKLIIDNGTCIKGLSECINAIIDIEEDIDFILGEMNNKTELRKLKKNIFIKK
ncbi:hypothetical protein [Clostridium beijerinckii]|uniref:Uncharacterized protein n=1 Tax=Clostridium beijerinckii TaxID=1520 RepID=A0AAX0B117_CLOBE|nr:hypothetical protein [Clostridium beijerinckii]NRT88559.1 hypothetical protein [Clostridium beijerinckii]NYC74014.1 hypothetical protein [Clostridium beijerinckii]